MEYTSVSLANERIVENQEIVFIELTQRFRYDDSNLLILEEKDNIGQKWWRNSTDEPFYKKGTPQQKSRRQRLNYRPRKNHAHHEPYKRRSEVRSATRVASLSFPQSFPPEADPPLAEGAIRNPFEGRFKNGSPTEAFGDDRINTYGRSEARAKKKGASAQGPKASDPKPKDIKFTPNAAANFPSLTSLIVKAATVQEEQPDNWEAYDAGLKDFINKNWGKRPKDLLMLVFTLERNAAASPDRSILKETYTHYLNFVRKSQVVVRTHDEDKLIRIRIGNSDAVELADYSVVIEIADNNETSAQALLDKLTELSQQGVIELNPLIPLTQNKGHLYFGEEKLKVKPSVLMVMNEDVEKMLADLLSLVITVRSEARTATFWVSGMPSPVVIQNMFDLRIVIEKAVSAYGQGDEKTSTNRHQRIENAMNRNLWRTHPVAMVQLLRDLRARVDGSSGKRKERYQFYLKFFRAAEVAIKRIFETEEIEVNITGVDSFRVDTSNPTRTAPLLLQALQKQVEFVLPVDAGNEYLYFGEDPYRHEVTMQLTEQALLDLEELLSVSVRPPSSQKDSPALSLLQIATESKVWNWSDDPRPIVTLPGYPEVTQSTKAGINRRASELGKEPKRLTVGEVVELGAEAYLKPGFGEPSLMALVEFLEQNPPGDNDKRSEVRAVPRPDLTSRRSSDLETAAQALQEMIKAQPDKTPEDGARLKALLGMLLPAIEMARKGSFGLVRDVLTAALVFVNALESKNLMDKVLQTVIKKIAETFRQYDSQTNPMSSSPIDDLSENLALGVGGPQAELDDESGRSRSEARVVTQVLGKKIYFFDKAQSQEQLPQLKLVLIPQKINAGSVDFDIFTEEVIAGEAIAVAPPNSSTWVVSEKDGKGHIVIRNFDKTQTLTLNLPSGPFQVQLSQSMFEKHQKGVSFFVVTKNHRASTRDLREGDAVELHPMEELILKIQKPEAAPVEWNESQKAYIYKESGLTYRIKIKSGNRIEEIIVSSRFEAERKKVSGVSQGDRLFEAIQKNLSRQSAGRSELRRVLNAPASVWTVMKTFTGGMIGPHLLMDLMRLSAEKRIRAFAILQAQFGISLVHAATDRPAVQSRFEQKFGEGKVRRSEVARKFSSQAGIFVYAGDSLEQLIAQPEALWMLLQDLDPLDSKSPRIFFAGNQAKLLKAFSARLSNRKNGLEPLERNEAARLLARVEQGELVGFVEGSLDSFVTAHPEGVAILSGQGGTAVNGALHFSIRGAENLHPSDRQLLLSEFPFKALEAAALAKKNADLLGLAALLRKEIFWNTQVSVRDGRFELSASELLHNLLASHQAELYTARMA
jgi:hypothetical protein